MHANFHRLNKSVKKGHNQWEPRFRENQHIMRNISHDVTIDAAIENIYVILYYDMVISRKQTHTKT